MIKTFLENLDVVATSEMAFVAYILVLLVWGVIWVKRRRLKFIEGVIGSLNYEDKMNTIYNEFDIYPSSKLTPEQWLKQKQSKYIFYAFFASLIAILVVFTIKTNTIKTSSVGNRSEKEVLIAAKTKVNEYLQSLSEETFEASNFFAPITEKFFDKTNLTRDRIDNFINKHYYKKYTARTVHALASSWKLLEQNEESCTLSFLMVGNWYDTELRKAMEAKSRIIVKFDADFKILYFSEDEILKYKSK